MTFIKKNIALGSTIGEIHRKDRWEYPLEAIREALINAIIHRDYAILGSDIKVAIYDDMLEITSPGTLPDSLPIEELGSGRSEIRNRILAPIFKDLKLIEAWGSGIQKIRQELDQYPEIGLILQEVGSAFQVQFVKKYPGRAESGQSQGRVRAESGQSGAETEAESLQQKVVNVLARDALSKSEIANKIELKSVTGYFNRTIRSMLTKGLIEYTIPEKPNSRLQKYKLKKN
jgi:predicted HTH transcriptional regulator